MAAIDELKFNLRESTHPYFTDTELQTLLDRYATTDTEGNPVYDINKSTYDGLIIKSEAKEFKLGDTVISNDSKYWLRLARQYRTNYTGTLKRVDEE